jgi:hypothetical protein
MEDAQLHAKSGTVQLFGELGQGLCLHVCMHGLLACLVRLMDGIEVGVWD